MKIIVTGGLGFIGSNLTDKLIELGHDVTVIDNLSRGSRDNLNSKAKFVKKDIRSNHIIPYFEGVDYVFHLAALARIQPSITDPYTYHKNNVNGTVNVLKACQIHHVKRVIYSASSSAYGPQEVMPEVETMMTNPLNPYAATKLIGEIYMKVWSACYGIDTVSLRYFNAFGPRQALEGAYATVIGIFLQQSKEGKPMTIVGTGEQRRSFTHVSDVVNANIKAMEYEGKLNGEVINIGYPKSTSINEIADLIGGERVNIPPRPAEVQETLPDIIKAKELLGWAPLVSTEEGIKELQGLTN